MKEDKENVFGKTNAILRLLCTYIFSYNHHHNFSDVRKHSLNIRQDIYILEITHSVYTCLLTELKKIIYPRKCLIKHSL